MAHPLEFEQLESSQGDVLVSGPFPTPDRLQQYAAIDPELAAKVVDAIAQQQIQRTELMKAIVQADQRYSATFLILGCGVLCLSLGLSTYIIWDGHEVIGSLIAGGSLITALTLGICTLALQARKHRQQLRSLSGEEVQRKAELSQLR